MKKRGAPARNKARPLLIAAAGVALVTYNACAPEHVGNLRAPDNPPAPEDAGPAPTDDSGTTPITPSK
jgi:hypothetical protein